jgi:hypothetical protein
MCDCPSKINGILVYASLISIGTIAAVTELSLRSDHAKTRDVSGVVGAYGDFFQ